VLRALTIFALVLLAATTAAASTAEDTPPTLTEACGSTNELEARSFWLLTYDRVRLYAIEAGSGPNTIVLAHQAASNLCETLSFAGKFVANGYRIVAFDFRGNGNSQSPSRNSLALGRDLAAAVAHARRTGAQRVFLMGSSMGGAAIVQNTSSLRVDGRISFSGTRFSSGYGVNYPKGLARIRAPFLYVGTRNDRRTPLREALGILRRIGARDKRTALYPGTEHGWQIIENTRLGSRRLALVLHWLEARS
jgi:dienelactone hydrolase